MPLLHLYTAVFITFDTIHIHAIRTHHFHHNISFILTPYPLFYNYTLQHRHLTFENLPVYPLLHSTNRQIRPLLPPQTPNDGTAARATHVVHDLQQQVRSMGL
jgi:hypothetical protein